MHVDTEIWMCVKRHGWRNLNCGKQNTESDEKTLKVSHLSGVIKMIGDSTSPYQTYPAFRRKLPEENVIYLNHTLDLSENRFMTIPSALSLGRPENR